MSWVVYILLCNDVSFYVGITSNFQQRLNSHRKGQNIGTKEFKDIKLVYRESYRTRREAEKREKQLKGWSRAKKEALIQGDLELLSKLSKSKTRKVGEG